MAAGFDEVDDTNGGATDVVHGNADLDEGIDEKSSEDGFDRSASRGTFGASHRSSHGEYTRMAAKSSSKTEPTTRDNRDKAVDLALGQIRKQFGDGSIMKMGDESQKKIAMIPTGSIALDQALGIGGVPRGRIVELYGPESSGKSTLAMHIVAEAQKRGGIAAYIDAEHAFDPTYAKLLGVDIDNLLISQPDSGEDALGITDTLVRSAAIDVIVVDSVAALVPRAELDGEMGDSHVGLQARLMSQALRKLTGSISKSHTCVIFINQIRMKIGVMFGNPETTTGGNALKFYSSVRMDIRRISTIKDGDETIGSRTRVRVVKNKVAPPFRMAEFDLMHGEGISRAGELVDLGTELGIVSKSGTWYSIGDERIGQGRENAKQYLRDHPELMDELTDAVREKLQIPIVKADGTIMIAGETVTPEAPAENAE
jgi:recombination protein RecA